MDIDEEIHNKIVNALKRANFPIKNEEELFNSFPQGEGGKCTVGAFQMSVTGFRRLLSMKISHLKMQKKLHMWLSKE